MKPDLSILVIDRPIKENENVVSDVFMVYGEKYKLLVFPPKEKDPECRIQIVFFKYGLISDMESLFHISINYDIDDPDDFFDFDLTEIEIDTFYDILNQIFEITIFNLTQIEVKP